MIRGMNSVKTKSWSDLFRVGFDFRFAARRIRPAAASFDWVASTFDLVPSFKLQTKRSVGCKQVYYWNEYLFFQVPGVLLQARGLSKDVGDVLESVFRKASFSMFFVN
jgi:hypothetical protein